MNNNLLRLQSNIIYGPVNSRRLGRSLGINVLPVHKKVCSFDCLYCQYGFTRINAVDLKNIKLYADRGQIKYSVETAIKHIDTKPDYITFSGNGEATLHPRFPDLVTDLLKIRDKYAGQSKTAILSNSTMLGETNIRNALNLLDEKIMKLDVGSEEMLQVYNRPVQNISLSEIVKNLKLITGVTIQALFSSGEAGNTKPAHIINWVEKIKTIQPKNVQIYTLDRGYPSRKIVPAEFKTLIAIKAQLDELDIPCEVY